MLILAAFLTMFPLREMETVSGSQRLILIRHGECTLNLPDQARVSGKSLEVPLTPKGEEQARALAQELKTKVDPSNSLIICSSTALRAQQTARCLMEELSCQQGRSYEGLCELGHGHWEGMPKDEKYLKELHKWEILSAKEKLNAPMLKSGESYQAVIDRALAALQQIIDTHRNKTVFVVTHFRTLNALSLHWSGAIETLSQEPGSKLPQQIFDNCDFLVVEFPEGGTVQTGTLLMHVKSHILN